MHYRDAPKTTQDDRALFLGCEFLAVQAADLFVDAGYAQCSNTGVATPVDYIHEAPVS
jgi:hypothetical protein